jgi:hypothetical protein
MAAATKKTTSRAHAALLALSPLEGAVLDAALAVLEARMLTEVVAVDSQSSIHHFLLQQRAVQALKGLRELRGLTSIACNQRGA